MDHRSGEWLKAEFNLEQHDGPATPLEIRPKWDAETHTLLFGQQPARTVKRTAKNIITILTCFEEDGWPKRIDNPLQDDIQRREAIRQLNKGLRWIRFSADGSGEGIVWSRSDAQ